MKQKHFVTWCNQNNKLEPCLLSCWILNAPKHCYELALSHMVLQINYLSLAS